MSEVLEFTDFSGGATDYYVDSAMNKYEDADNFLILKYGEVGRLFTRPGSEIWSDSNPQIPAGAQRVGTLFNFGGSLFMHSARKFYYGTSMTTLQGPSSNDVFPSGMATTNYVSWTEAQGHLIVTADDFSRPSKIYKDGSGNMKLRTAGLPVLPTIPSASSSSGAGAKSYIYRFHLQYTYTVGAQIWVDNGPTVERVVTALNAPNTSAVNITSIPVLANSTTYNYDTANVKVMIARTIDTGQAFYYVGEVTNGTTTYNDTTSDATLQLAVPLYTEGGYVENIEPPLCKYVHACNNTVYYAHTKSGSEVFKGRVFQAVQGDPDGVGEDFWTDCPQEITGISSFQDIPILGTTAGIFKINGTFTEVGQGFMSCESISETATCISGQSMVQTPDGVFWAGHDGFYWSNGFLVKRISSGLKVSYQDLIDSSTKKLRIQGSYDKVNNLVFWAAGDGAEIDDNNCLWVLDLNWGMSDDMPFTFWSGTSLSPTAITFDANGNLIRGHKSGYILQHSDTVYTDPKVNTAVSAASWTTETIIYNYKGPATNFGTGSVRKWVTGCDITMENTTNVSVQIISNNDKGRQRTNLSPIRNRSNFAWGDEDLIWGSADLRWNMSGLIMEKRRMPAQNLRCMYKQIEITNAKVAIVNSEIMGTVSTNGTTNAVVLDDGGQIWPTSPIDYYVAFETDGYVKEYQVTARTDSTLTVSDVENVLPTSSGLNWVLRGYPRGDVLQLIQYNVNYTVFGQTQNVYRSASSGEVDA